MHPQIRSHYRCSCGVKKFDPMSNGKSPIYRWTPYIFSKKKVQTIIPRSILVGLIQNLRWKVETMVLYGFCTGKPGLPSDSAQIRHVTSSSGAKVSVLVCLAACRRVGPQNSIVGGQYLDHANHPDHPWSSWIHGDRRRYSQPIFSYDPESHGLHQLITPRIIEGQDLHLPQSQIDPDGPRASGVFFRKNGWVML